VLPLLTQPTPAPRSLKHSIMYTPSRRPRQITEFGQTGSSYLAHFSWCHRESAIAMAGDRRAPGLCTGGPVSSIRTRGGLAAVSVSSSGCGWRGCVVLN
jgi:hypothetical protein